MFRKGLMAALALGAVLMTSSAMAQSWPNRPLRIVVAFPPGGVADAIPRKLQNALQDALGQPVIVENKPGGAGLIGMEAIAKATDNHTVGVMTLQNLTVPAVGATMPYDARKDLQGIKPIWIDLLNVSAAERSFIGQHFGLEQLKQLTGVNMVHVPFKGAAPLHTALLAGEVSVGFNIILLPLQHVKTGKLRALAVASTKRAPLAPEIPTMAEEGYPIDFDTWYGFYAPAGTSKEIIAKLNTETVRILAIQDFKDRAAVMGVELSGTTPERLAAHMRTEIARWTKVAKAANMKID